MYKRAIRRPTIYALNRQTLKLLVLFQKRLLMYRHLNNKPMFNMCLENDW